MKLIFKGKYVNEEQLPKGVLPENAVKFIEPETPKELKRKALLFVIPAVALIFIITVLSFLIHENRKIELDFFTYVISTVLYISAILPHEILHGVCFGKDAEVELYYSIKNMMAFVVCTEPVSKARFIWLCLCPNVVLGWLPLLLWAVLPGIKLVSGVLYIFSIFMIISGIGDYLNVYNAAKQMPKGSYQQLSGFHSYWFVK
jgi:hypothetical protein